MASGGNIGAYIDVPSLMITIGGAIGATIISNPGARLKAMGGCLKNVFMFQEPDLVGMVQMIVSFAEKARREGLLSLEADVAEVDSEFMRKAIQLVVDGTDPELVRAILDTEIGNFEDRHSANKAVFDHLTEFAPSFGMIGTLIGLIAMLGNLS
ncbi:MAG: MotA/TolQ/ExbB proton channel family protein, partial [Synergistaceae bacterium]|nr:MotA/TolQ/ExbB proton channel family protein [Synergistaceae bacterium]